MSVIIKNCSCVPHKFQDETYGVGNRVHNVGGKGDKCTVCGKINSDSNSYVRKKKK